MVHCWPLGRDVAVHRVGVTDWQKSRIKKDRDVAAKRKIANGVDAGLIKHLAQILAGGRFVYRAHLNVENRHVVRPHPLTQYRSSAALFWCVVLSFFAPGDCTYRKEVGVLYALRL